MDTKTLAAKVKARKDPESSAGEFEAIASVAAVDRDGEIIDFGSFEPLPASVPVHDGHDFTRPIARGVPYYEGRELRVRGVFASTERAQEVRTLVSEGIIDSMSVAFIPKKTRQVDGRKHITQAELLAVDFVSVPSLREAQVLSARGYRGTSSADEEVDRLYAEVLAKQIEVTAQWAGRGDEVTNDAYLKAVKEERRRKDLADFDATLPAVPTHYLPSVGGLAQKHQRPVQAPTPKPYKGGRLSHPQWHELVYGPHLRSAFESDADRLLAWSEQEQAIRRELPRGREPWAAGHYAGEVDA